VDPEGLGDNSLHGATLQSAPDPHEDIRLAAAPRTLDCNYRPRSEEKGVLQDGTGEEVMGERILGEVHIFLRACRNYVALHCAHPQDRSRSFSLRGGGSGRLQPAVTGSSSIRKAECHRTAGLDVAPQA